MNMVRSDNEVFLSRPFMPVEETDPFVSKLIGAISSKAYVSAQDSAGHHAAGSTEKERLSLKRPAEDDSASVGAKASRIDSVVASESGFSSPKTRGEIRNGGAEPGSGGERSDRTVASRTQDMRAQQGQRRQKCRDFHGKCTSPLRNEALPRSDKHISLRRRERLVQSGGKLQIRTLAGRHSRGPAVRKSFS